MEVFTGMVDRLGFPLPALFAYAAALAEFFGGIAVLLGVFTRFFSALIAIVMLVALVAVKKFAFPAADADFALLMISIALVCMGPGAYSLSCMMGEKKNGDACCNDTGCKKNGEGCCNDGEHKHEHGTK